MPLLIYKPNDIVGSSGTFKLNVVGTHADRTFNIIKGSPAIGDKGCGLCVAGEDQGLCALLPACAGHKDEKGFIKDGHIYFTEVT